MKTIRIVFFALLFLSAPQARAAGPGGVERVGAIDLGLNLTPANPLSVLYLQRSQLLIRQMDTAIDLRTDERALANELAYIARAREERANDRHSNREYRAPYEKKYSNEEMAAALLAIGYNESALNLSESMVAKAKELASSVDKKRHALVQLKAMLESTNEEIKAMTRAGCSCSTNPSSPGAASAKGPCSC